jgi:beta-lactamase regulating signal transducer with metallopeptidase domain
MIPLLASLDELGFPTMRYLLSALWQSSLLFAATFALSYLLRRRRAAVRHALWALALLMAPFLPLLTRGFERAGAPQVRLTMLPAYHNDEVRMMKDEGGRMKDEVRRMKDKGGRMKDEWRQNASVALPPGAETGLETMPRAGMRSVLDYPWALGLIAYIVGLSLFLIWIVVGRLRIRQWIGAAMPATDERVLAAFRQAREALRFHRPCLVLQSPRVPVPISVGILHSRVLLPSALAARLSDEELRAVALHETAHLSRRDPLVLTLAALVRAALFFHPLVWLAARRVSTLAEHCADAAVLDATGRPLPYAELLARLAEELPARPFAAEMATGILLSKGAFLRRVEAILGDRDRARRLTRRALAGTAAAVLLSVIVAVALPLGSTEGNKSKKPEKGESEESTRFPSQPVKAAAGSSETAEQQIQRSIARWDFTRAIPAAEALLKQAPDDRARGRCHLLLAQAYGVWGVEYRDAVARDKGRQHLEQAFKLDPSLKQEMDVAHLRACLLAYRQSSKGEVNQALEDAQKEIKGNPRNAQAPYSLGMLHHVLATNSDFAYTKPEQDEERRLALESMAKAVELDPKRYEYWSYYVSALAYAGQKEEAKKAADRMMKESDLSQEKIPPSATCAYEILSALMDPEEGCAYVRAQAARDPSYAPLQFVAAERYAEKDPVRYKMLTDLAARIASGDLRLPTWQARLELTVLYKLGVLHCQSGKLEKALEDYDRIISLSPYYAEVRLNRALVYRTLAERAATPEGKARLLEKAKNDFEAQLQYPWHDKVSDARERLNKTVKDLETLRAGEAKPVPQATQAVTASLSKPAESKTDAIFKGAFALDKDIPVSLQWDTAERKRLVWIETLRFEVKEFRAGAFVIREIHALIPVHYLSGPKAKWNIQVLLLDEMGNILQAAQETMENGGTIFGVAALEKKDLDIRFTGVEPARVARFEIRITDASSSSAAAFGSGIPSGVDAHTSESAKAKPGEPSK